MSVLGRLSRLFAIPLVIAVIAGTVAVTGYAIAPHSERALTAADFGRQDVQFNLDVGGRRTLVYDRYGAQISELRFGTSNREPVALATVPPQVWQTVLAVEDEKFFEHHGVDLRGIGRALLTNVETGGISQGGSTLTQQIVKLLYVGSEQSLTRKLREAFLAARLEEQYTKDELLEFYLNFVYFGNGAYGIEAAAETYYGKSASELDVGDAALLAGLIRSPSVFDGFTDVETARRRRGDSLQRALDVGLITEAEMAQYDARPLPDRDRSPGQQFHRNYYLEEVQQELLAMPELGATETERFDAVFGGGLRVYTAFDPILQRDMEAAKAESFPAGLGDFDVSVATIDHRTGQVLAFLGGPAFAESQFNLATQGRRQPGSSFKTYVLAAAFEYGGFQPNDVVAGNGPCQFDVGAREPYKVQNFGNSGGRVGTVRSQTLASSNCAFVRLGLATGLDHVARTADALVGRETGDEFQPFPSMSLGAQEITPLEQAVGYGALANDGVRMEPYYVDRIEDADGTVLFQRVPIGKRVVSSRTARLVVDTLVANVAVPGTGGRARLDSGQQAGGKTGTAQDFTNAWFVGFTPQLTTAVWMGNPEANVPMRRVDFDGNGSVNVTGGSYPAKMWNAVMTKALAGRPLEEFPGPPALDRGGKVIFLENDVCPVGLGLQDGSSLTVRLPCSQVDVNGMDFTPKGSAQCGVNVPQPDGSTRSQTVPCGQVSSIYGTTTTTTTTTAPPATTPTTAAGTGAPPPKNPKPNGPPATTPPAAATTAPPTQ